MDPRRLIVLGVVLLLVVPLVGVAVYDFLDARDSGTLHVSQPDRDIPSNETVAFDSLTSEQQQVFERALDSEDGFASIPWEVNETVWTENRGVRYENETYGVAVAVR